MVHDLVADWAAQRPRIRRVWISAAERIALELEPVADSEETLAVWITNCGKWHAELEVRLGRPVSLAWLDPDAAWREPVEEGTRARPFSGKDALSPAIHTYQSSRIVTPIVPASS
jgi:hypothetical protein